MYSLSTCWNSHRHTDGRAMLREIRELGFEFAELSHGIRLSLVPGILEAVDAGEIKISSLHNFCPLPMGVERAAPNIFKFSADNPRERESAVKHTLKTLDLAVRLQAPVVVLHLGSIDMKDYTDKLIDLVGEGKKETPKYEKLCQEVLMKREDKKERYVKAAYDTLRRLVTEAESRALKLGIENREALEEIPFESDYALFFKEFTSSAVVYWHDTGHAQIKENLGFIHHAFHLESLQDKLYGLHIHDVKFPGRDHCAPGTGTVDFAALKPWVKLEHVKVFEFSPSMPPEEVSRGAAHVRALWGKE
jgi:sugar phosphate isomerase/epimerase